jgi:hypothetical protein
MLALLLAAPALATPYDKCGTLIAGPAQCVIFHPDDDSGNVWALPVPAQWHVGDHTHVSGQYVLCPNVCQVPCVTGAVYSVCTTGCRADFNNSGTVTTGDIFDFLNAWFAGSLSADFDDSGALSTSDIFAFLNAWLSGC